MRPVPLEVEVWYMSPGVPGQHSALTPNLLQKTGGLGVASPVQPARHVVLYKFTWQASWDRGARWRWVSLAHCAIFDVGGS